MVQPLAEDSITENEKIHDPDLESHLRALGLNSTAEYQTWCARYGYSLRVDKHWRERCRERFFTARASIAIRSKRKRDEKCKPRRIIQQIFDGQVQEADLSLPQFKLVHATAADIRDRETLDAFQQLLLHIVERTGLIQSQTVIQEVGVQPGNTFVDGLLALARCHSDWIRSLGNWRPQSHNVRRQFGSLARHLLARYSVPMFLDCVWFKGNTPKAAKQQAWFKAIGNGASVCELDLPIPLTRRMGYHFLRAPDDSSVEAAMRWGQVMGLSGSVRLVRAILASRLGTSFEDNDFWITVIRWFIQNPLFDPAQIGPAIDYIHHERLQLRQTVTGSGTEPQGEVGVCSRFSMKGRTPAALLQRMREWHAGLRREPPKPQLEWVSSGFGPLDWIDGTPASTDGCRWTIVELRSRKELYHEGGAMRHCVASYDQSCAAGATSIWSMCLERNQSRRKRVLTIEVSNRSNRICQVRGKVNRLPSEKELNVVRRWAAQEGLVLGALI